MPTKQSRGGILLDLIKKINEIQRRREEEEQKLARIGELATLGDRLIAAREAARKTQVESAHHLGLKTQGMLSRYEGNRRLPSLDVLRRLSDYYQVDVKSLIPPTDVEHYFLSTDMAQQPSSPDSFGSLKFGIVPVVLKNDDMAPVFLKGDVIFVDTKKRPTHPGQYALVKQGNIKILCQIFADKDKCLSVLLHPDASRKAFSVNPENLVGVVVELRRSFVPHGAEPLISENADS